MPSRGYTQKEFIKKLNEFLEAVEKDALVKAKFTDQDILADLFRFWWADFRDQEVVQEVRDEDRGFPDLLG